MGMFDFINYKANCENCGKELTEFQSKDGECLMRTLQPKDVDSFYSICDNCNAWHDFEVERVCTVNNITVTIREEN